MAETEPVQTIAGMVSEGFFSGLGLQAMLLVCAVAGFAATTRYFQKHYQAAVNEKASSSDSASKSKGASPKAAKTNNKAKGKAKAAKAAAVPPQETAQELAAEEISAEPADLSVAAAPVAAAADTGDFVAEPAAATVEATDEGWLPQKKAGSSRSKAKDVEKQAPAAAVLAAAPERTAEATPAESSLELAASTAASTEPPVPLLHCPGGEFNGSHFIDLAARGGSVGTFGGAISISFSARWDALNSWSRVVDFGSGAQRDNVIIANFEQRNTLVADVYRGAARKRLLVQDVISIGEVHRYLLTVSSVGCMRMYMDGIVVGELSKGYAPKDVERSHLYVGKPSSSDDEMFQGCILDVKLWSEVVDWDVAFLEQSSASAPQFASVLPSTATTAESAVSTAVPDEEVSERVVKLMAKKAERKARKARERQEQEKGIDDRGEEEDRREEEDLEAADASATAASAAQPEQALTSEEAAAKQAAVEEAEAKHAEEEAAAKEAEKEAAAQKAASEAAAEREAAEREAAEAASRRAADEESAAQTAGSANAAEAPAPDEGASSTAPRPAREKASSSKSSEKRRKAAAKEEKEEASPPQEEAPPPQEEVPATSTTADRVAWSEVPISESVGEAADSGTGEAVANQPAALVDEDGFEVAAPSRQRKALKAQQRAAEAEQRKQTLGPSSQASSQPSEAPSQVPSRPPGKQARRPAAEAPVQTVPAEQLQAPRAQVRGLQSSRAEAPDVQDASAGTEGATRTTAPPRTALERDILKYEKKLREVDRLRVRQEAGEALEPNQLEKLSKIDALRQRLTELLQQQALEAEKTALAQSEAQVTDPSEQVEAGEADPGQRASLREWAMNASRSAAPFVTGQPAGKGKKGDVQEQWMDSLENIPYAQVCNTGPICIGGKGDIRTPLVAPGPGFMEIGKEFEEGAMPPMPFGHMMPLRGPEPEPEFDPNGSPPAVLFGSPDMASMELQMPPSQAEERWESCWEWVRTGWCPRGITCRWEHPALGPVAFGSGAQFWPEDEGQLPPGVVLAPPGAMMGPAGQFMSPDPENLTQAAGLQTGMAVAPGMTVGVLPPGGLPPGPIPDGVMTFSEELQNPCYDILGEDVEASGIVTPQ